MPALRRRLLFSAVTAALVLGAAELTCQVLEPAAAPARLAIDVGGGQVQDPDYGWRGEVGGPVAEPNLADRMKARGMPLPPSLRDQRRNAMGFADGPIAMPRPPSQQRVLCLGDSSVAGSGVLPEDRFSERLERALNGGAALPPAERAVDVINGGVPGYSSYQALRQLRDSLFLGLDAVVVYLGNSDVMPVRSGVPDSSYFPVQWGLTGVGPTLQRSALYRAARKAIRERRRSQPLGMFETQRVAPGPFADNLRAMVALGERHGFRGVFVVPATNDAATPGVEGAGEGHPRDVLAAVMREVASESGWSIVDGPATFAARSDLSIDPNDWPDSLFFDAVHPSGLGHELLAEAILPALQTELSQAVPWSDRPAALRELEPPAFFGRETARRPGPPGGGGGALPSAPDRSGEVEYHALGPVLQSVSDRIAGGRLVVVWSPEVAARRDRAQDLAWLEARQIDGAVIVDAEPVPSLRPGQAVVVGHALGRNPPAGLVDALSQRWRLREEWTGPQGDRWALYMPRD